MTTEVTSRIGLGRDFPTLSDWARAVPQDLTRADERHIAVLSASIEDPGGARLTAICDETRYLEIRAEPGESHRDLFDPVTDPLALTPGLGAMIRTAKGPALRLAHEATRVRLTGLQILAEDGPVVQGGGPEEQACLDVTHCLMEASSSAPALVLGGPDAQMSASVLIQRGLGDGVVLSEGAAIAQALIVKPGRRATSGRGIAVPEGAGTAQNTAVFGFQEALDERLIGRGPLVSDQINLIEAPDNFAHASWRSEGATVERFDVLPGPSGSVFQRLGNKQNAYARFTSTDPFDVDAGDLFSASALVAKPQTVSSALMLDGPDGTAELTVDWSTSPPTARLRSDQRGFLAVAGGVNQLGAETWRLWLTAENRGNAAIRVYPGLAVAHGIGNVGLTLGLHAGGFMAGPGHLGGGFARHTPHITRGTDPAEALRCIAPHALDLRPLPGGPLDDLWPTGADLRADMQHEQRRNQS